MKKGDLIKYLLENNTEVPFIQVVLGMLVALLLALVIFQIYRLTYTGVMYSREFNTTIVMLCLITTLVIMIIGSNLALSLGMVGALSIIRFRTAVKDAKDAAYLFWAIGVGLSCGTGIYSIGIVGSVIIAAVLLFIFHIRGADGQAFLLVLRGGEVDMERLEELLGQLTRKHFLKMTSRSGQDMEITYEISPKAPEGRILSEVQGLDGLYEVHLLSYNGELAGQ